jgi:putative intracellular protease/amidase
MQWATEVSQCDYQLAIVARRNQELIGCAGLRQEGCSAGQAELWDRGENSKILDSAKALLVANIPVAAICGATAGLARAGILDGISHTSNAPEYLQATN